MKSTGFNLNRKSSSRENNLQSVYRQRRARRKKIDLFLYMAVGVKALSGFLITVCLSVALVFVYSFITQCDYFRAETVDVKGIQRLGRMEVLNQAGITDGVNILSVNLGTVQKRLSAHSDIYTAEIQRTLPRGLTLVIQEQSPLAVVDWGEKYLMNVQGMIYKKWKGDIPKDIPLVTGLDFSDFEDPRNSENSMRTVLNLLRSKQVFLEKSGMEPLVAVHVDRLMGITLKFAGNRVLKLGYGHYDKKWARLDRVLNFMRNEYEFKTFDAIDLSNANRVVLKPVKPEAAIHKDEEV
jgi:cell division protein FtsQ